MTENVQRLTNALSEKILAIQNEVLRLKKENRELSERVEAKQVRCDECEVRLNELEHKYNALKIAKSLNDETGSAEARKRMDAMVREIDKCIELINE